MALGEMGIGNTTAAAAVAAALGGGEVAAWVGRGTGLDDEGMDRKRDAVRLAVDRIAGRFGERVSPYERIPGLIELDGKRTVLIPDFDRLTEEAVVAWVQDKLGARAVDGHKASLARAVEARLDPPVVPVPLPWSAS